MLCVPVPDCLGGPLLALLHYGGVFLDLGSPKLISVFEMQSHEVPDGGSNHSLDLCGYAPANAARYMTGILHMQIRCWHVFTSSTRTLTSCRAAFQPCWCQIYTLAQSCCIALCVCLWALQAHFFGLSKFLRLQCNNYSSILEVCIIAKTVFFPFSRSSSKSLNNIDPVLISKEKK